MGMPASRAKLSAIAGGSDGNCGAFGLVCGGFSPGAGGGTPRSGACPIGGGGGIRRPWDPAVCGGGEADGGGTGGAC